MKMQSQSTSCPNSIGQAAAIQALSGPQDHVGARQDGVRRDKVAWLMQFPGRRRRKARLWFASCAGVIERTPVEPSSGMTRLRAALA